MGASINGERKIARQAKTGNYVTKVQCLTEYLPELLPYEQ